MTCCCSGNLTFCQIICGGMCFDIWWSVYKNNYKQKTIGGLKMLARINRGYVPAYWDDFFNDTFFNNYKTANYKGTSPAVNVVEEEREFRIDFAVPGLSKEDFRIDLEKDVLTVSSENKEKRDDKGQNYMRREFSYSTFKRSFQLPESVDIDNIKASHDAGILSIQLPKKEEMVEKAPKQIEIS